MSVESMAAFLFGLAGGGIILIILHIRALRVSQKLRVQIKNMEEGIDLLVRAQESKQPVTISRDAAGRMTAITLEPVVALWRAITPIVISSVGDHARANERATIEASLSATNEVRRAERAEVRLMDQADRHLTERDDARKDKE